MPDFDFKGRTGYVGPLPVPEPEFDGYFSGVFVETKTNRRLVWPMTDGQLPLRPRDVPTLRDRLAHGWLEKQRGDVDPGFFAISEMWNRFAEVVGPDAAYEYLNQERPSYMRDAVSEDVIAQVSQSSLWSVSALERAKLLWLSQDFCSLVDMIRPTVPDDLTLTQADPPWPNGFVVFAEPLVGISIQDQPVVLHALAWAPNRVVGVDGASLAVALEFYTAAQYSNGAAWSPIGRSEWVVDSKDGPETVSGLSEAHRAAVERDHHLGPEATANLMLAFEDDRRIATAVWSAIRLNAAERSTWQPANKAKARKAKRKGEVLPEVEVVRLRGSWAKATEQSGGSADAGDGEPGAGSKWSCRWLVRPHLRWQACGPGRAERRLIAIEPYVKGPEDKPFRASRPKVYRVD